MNILLAISVYAGLAFIIIGIIILTQKSSSARVETDCAGNSPPYQCSISTTTKYTRGATIGRNNLIFGIVLIVLGVSVLVTVWLVRRGSLRDWLNSQCTGNLDPNRPRLYCGNNAQLPAGYIGRGTPYQCLQKGFGTGFCAAVEKMKQQ